ncbi:MAG: sugar nucleotide-binding protein, partial [Lachnospiraceae bacterium]
IRSSWIYGIGKDFLNEVLEAANNDSITTLTLKDNAQAVPTSAAELAKIVKIFIDDDHFGVYHAVCSGGGCTRLEYAREILRLAHKEDALTITVAPDAPQKYSVLDNMMLRITGLPEPQDWRQALAAYMQETGGLE